MGFIILFKHDVKYYQDNYGKKKIIIIHSSIFCCFTEKNDILQF